MAGQGADAIVLHIMLGCKSTHGGLVMDLLYSYNAVYLYKKVRIYEMRV